MHASTNRTGQVRRKGIMEPTVKTPRELLEAILIIVLQPRRGPRGSGYNGVGWCGRSHRGGYDSNCTTGLLPILKVRMEDRPLITRVVLENYKSIAFCDVKLGPLSILVGPNGAGKSNFLDAMRFLSEVTSAGPTQIVFQGRGGFLKVLRQSANDGATSVSGLNLPRPRVFPDTTRFVSCGRTKQITSLSERNVFSISQASTGIRGTSLTATSIQNCNVPQSRSICPSQPQWIQHSSLCLVCFTAGICTISAPRIFAYPYLWEMGSRRLQAMEEISQT